MVSVPGETSDDEWARIEAELWEQSESAEQRHADRVRTLGYALITQRRAVAARTRLENAVDALMRARGAAERALLDARRELDDAETMLLVVARGNPNEFARIALALEEAGH